MSVVDAIGWIAALSSASLALPQGARIAMTRSVAGVSVITWQTMLIAGLGWTAHGLFNGTPQIIWPNMLLGITSAWVLWQLTVAHKLPVLRTWSIPIAYAALAFGGDVVWGPIAFAAFAFVPGAIGQISQLREILRVPDPSGVSMVALLANLLNQVLWFSYALPAREMAVLSISPPMALIVAASVGALWWQRRRHAAAVLAGRAVGAGVVVDVISGAEGTPVGTPVGGAGSTVVIGATDAAVPAVTVLGVLPTPDRLTAEPVGAGESEVVLNAPSCD